MKLPRVLILCTGNSCRSQLAEALWRHESGGQWQVVSAGTAPKGVHPLTLRVLQEIGVSPDGLHSKHVKDIDLSALDLVVTVCDKARESCPLLPGSPRTLHWPFDDPAAATGSEEQILAVFRRVRDQIHERIRRFLAEEGSDYSRGK
ncbi:MAG: arsenate reductase ArsC [Gemmatales bacterium]|nr:arsenate reductase ArsC [Gemmatales bacterium]MDW8386270.1 arsenate reductase ArsC [Gemmatales bacterium]